MGRQGGPGWVGSSPGPGVRLSFLLNIKLEPVKSFRQDAVQKAPSGAKGLKETGWRQEGQLDATAAFLVSKNMSELGRGSGGEGGGLGESCMMRHGLASTTSPSDHHPTHTDEDWNDQNGKKRNP